jgi:hypothetical protein
MLDRLRKVYCSNGYGFSYCLINPVCFFLATGWFGSEFVYDGMILLLPDTDASVKFAVENFDLSFWIVIGSHLRKWLQKRRFRISTEMGGL